MPSTASWIDPHAVIRITGMRRRQRLELADQREPLLARRAAREVHVLDHQLARLSRTHSSACAGEPDRHATDSPPASAAAPARRSRSGRRRR